MFLTSRSLRYEISQIYGMAAQSPDWMIPQSPVTCFWRSLGDHQRRDAHMVQLYVGPLACRSHLSEQ